MYCTNNVLRDFLIFYYKLFSKNVNSIYCVLKTEKNTMIKPDIW